ncbi:MAG: hypothetical protein ACLP1Y_05300 [Candidatus Acidiferrales bacterium]
MQRALAGGQARRLAKEADDATQLAMGAVAATAADSSRAGTARIAARSVSGFFVITRRGRDALPPKFTEMNVMSDRPVTPPADSLK